MDELKSKGLSRKEFLKVAGLTALGLGFVTLTNPAKLLGLTAKAANSKKVRYGMVIDLKKCIGCHACTVACKQENNIPLGFNRTWVKDVEAGTYPAIKRIFLPMICNHCETPICNRNCPVNATYQRPDGIVLVDRDRCIGCKYCMVSCPYNMRFPHPYLNVADKCTFCVHRVDRGLKPACVDSCVGKARMFGNILDPKEEVYKIINTQPISVLKPEQNTKPRVFYLNLDYLAVEANKTDPKYMKYYRRNVARDMGLSGKQAEANYNVLRGKSNADKTYNYKIKDNINKSGTL